MKNAITLRNGRNDLFGDWDDFFFAPFKRENELRTDIREKDGKYILDVDLPGYEKENVSVEVENGYLTVRAERKEDHEDKDEKGNFLRRERSYGSVSRSFYVGDVKEDEVKASYKNGTLSVTVPSEEKRREESKKHIAIE